MVNLQAFAWWHPTCYAGRKVGQAQSSHATSCSLRHGLMVSLGNGCLYGNISYRPQWLTDFPLPGLTTRGVRLLRPLISCSSVASSALTRPWSLCPIFLAYLWPPKKVKGNGQYFQWCHVKNGNLTCPWWHGWHGVLSDMHGLFVWRLASRPGPWMMVRNMKGIMAREIRWKWL